MATYGRLLINAGGGIIDRGMQSEQEPDATVIIGLGGTGTDAVMRVKREVYRQLKPDDVDAVIPQYEHIKYLVIDSDRSKLDASKGKISDIVQSEYQGISNNAIKETLANKKRMDGRPEMYWMSYGQFDIDDAAAGAGGIRQVGRFLLIDRAEEVYLKIKTTIQRAMVGVAGGLNIHICSGISGGTGSGTFLDVCYLVRAVLSELGKTDANVCGYFFLPDVNLSVPVIAGDALKSAYVKVNGYAALKELDYCMNFGKNKDSFKMNYGFKEINTEQRPVDLCYLISATNSDGTPIKNGYDYAMGVVVDHIINFLAKVNVPAGVDPNTAAITLKGHISNLNTIKAGIQMQHGAGVEYHTLGASIAEMPLSEIATYLGAKLFESFEDIFSQSPTEKDVDDFIQAQQLRYEDVKNALCKGCETQLVFPKRFDARLFKDNGNNKFIDLAHKFMATNEGVLETNKKTFLEELKGYDLKAAGTSLIIHTFKGVCNRYVTKLKYGPFFAQRLLAGSNNFNLIHKVDGAIKTNQELLDSELFQSDRREMEFKSAEAAMMSANLINAGKRMEEYKRALNNLSVHNYKVRALQTMEEILEEYKTQLAKLDNNFFRILTIVLDTLRETFEENEKTMTEKVESPNDYNWKILSISDVKETLDNEVQKLDLEGALHHLMLGFCSNFEKWIDQDEGEITKLISEFVLEEFHDATKKTITVYLREKFGTDDATILTKKINDEIMESQLGKKSIPLFWKSPMYHTAAGTMITLTVPFSSAEICAAANAYAGNQKEGVTVRKSEITDKISMMRFYSGTPMFAYQGITDLQNAYEHDHKKGRHLYERGEVDWNKWLPSPVPYSFVVDDSDERNKILLEEFNQAKTKGIVYQDTMGGCFIRQTPDFSMDEFIRNQGEYKEGMTVNMKKLGDLITALKEKKAELGNPDKVENIGIECGNALKGNEEKVMLDFYLMSPVLNAIVRKELTKYAELDEKIEALEREKEQGEKEGKLKTKFFDAVFTGVISYGRKMVFEYEEFGISKSVELQSAKMKYGDTGAYQAFLTYMELDEKVRKTLDTITMERKDADDVPEVKVAIENLDSTMQQRIAVYMNQYDETAPLHDELEQFYKEFMKAFHNFKALYM